MDVIQITSFTVKFLNAFIHSNRWKKGLMVKIQLDALTILLCSENILLEKTKEIQIRDESRPSGAIIARYCTSPSSAVVYVSFGVNRSFLPRRGLRVPNGALRHDRPLWTVNAWLTRPGLEIMASIRNIRVTTMLGTFPWMSNQIEFGWLTGASRISA